MVKHLDTGEGPVRNQAKNITKKTEPLRMLQRNNLFLR